MPLRKLSNKIFIAVFLGTAINLVAVSIFAFLFTKGALQQSIMASQLELTRQGMDKIDRLLSERLTDIQTITGEEAIEGFLAHQADWNEKTMRKMIFRRIAELTVVTGPWDLLIIVDQEGKVILSSEEEEVGKSVQTNPRNAQAFEAVSHEGLYYSDLIIPENGDRPTMIFAAPVRNEIAPGQPVIGAIIGHFLWPAVLQILEDIPGRAAIFNHEGRMIGQNTEFAKANPSFRTITNSRLLQNLKDGHSTSLIEKREGVLAGNLLISLGAQSGYLSYQGSGWGLVLERPASAAFAPATKAALKLVLFLIPMIILTSIPILVLIFKWVNRPIAVLTQTTREIAAGNLNKEVPVASQDEMGELAVSFNSMTEKLRQAHDHLEQQVEERTEELLKTNEALRESEHKSQLVIETAQDAFVAIDAKGKVTNWNRQAEKIFGWPRQEAIGKLLAELIIPPQYREAHKQGIERYHQTGEGPVLNKQIEIAALHRDGHEFAVDLTIWPVRIEKEISFNAFIRDITERKKAELEIITSRTRFQNILDTASDAIISIDEDQKIILFNKQAQRIFGYEADEVFGRPLEGLLPERFRGRHREHVKGFAARPAPFQLMSQRPELFGLRKNGEEFPVQITISKLEMEGKLIFTAILRDISEQKKLEHLVLQSEKMSAVGQLAAGVAHEINNPLGVILGFSQNVVKRIQPGDPLELPLKSIEREAIRCKNLVQDLLTFSRAGKGEKEPVDVREAIEAALSLVLAQAKVKNVELVKEFSEVPDLVGNKNQIQQIIVNLSNNALDAMPNGGKLVIRLRKAKIDARDGVEIQVQDTGQGIPPEIRSKIFNPFFTTKEIGKGTGLGLSLVYEIAGKHNGRILFDSEVGKGTTFQVFLPLTEKASARG